MEWKDDFNIDSLRIDSETKTSWELRKQFVVKYRSQYKSARLLCLAEAYANSEVLGCNYPKSLMTLVKQLTASFKPVQQYSSNKVEFVISSASNNKTAVTNENKEKSCNDADKPYKIAFVKSTTNEAYEPDRKRRLTTETQTSERKKSVLAYIKSRLKRNASCKNFPETLVKFVDKAIGVEFSFVAVEEWRCTLTCDDVEVAIGIATTKKVSRSNAYQELESAIDYKPSVNRVAAKCTSRIQTSEFGPNFVLKYDLTKKDGLESSFFSTAVHQSAEFNRVPLRIDFEPCGTFVKCMLKIGGVTGETFRMEDIGGSRAESKMVVMKRAFYELQRRHPTLIIDPDAEVVGLSRSYFDSMTARQIPDDNIGLLMMQKYGWTKGEGLGTAGNGISGPIEASGISRFRSGLGSMTGENKFGSRLARYLEDYAARDSVEDVLFAEEFTKSERAEIHTQCSRYGLKSRSFGTDGARRLVISKCRNAAQVLNMVRKNGGSTFRYKLFEVGNIVVPE